MRIALTGASGNVATALRRRLSGTDVDVIGISRRAPGSLPARTTWREVDVAGPGAVPTLTEVFTGVDAVVHTAWLIQPARDPAEMARVNIGGSRNVVEAAVRAGVPHLVHLSSVGTYGTHPSDDSRVDEQWPTTGISPSQYSREKVSVERLLDRTAETYPQLLVTRVRPGLVFQRANSSEIARYFLGPFVPVRLLGRVPLPVLPLPRDVRFQVVHADDLAEALHRILLQAPGGAFNIADEPVLHGRDLGRVLRAARPWPVPPRTARAVVDATYRMRLHPTEPGWLDLLLGVPVMDTMRAREYLGWRPRRAAHDVLAELVTGMREHADAPTPPLRDQPKKP
ncbi:NAD-dependent epimerase/dehydratase family protein [Kineococcus gynurae]|uniref:NAD-dependent epimerase/dehydratase family protein n=1 Tax=Kineococcus gynurae TaxID=452979 RepID=A0ABV5LPD3_9ACTN